MDWLHIAERFVPVVNTDPVPELWERAASSRPSPLDEGHRINDAIRSRLASLDKEDGGRSYDQIRMQDLFQSACARIIYGRAYRMHQMEIMKYNRWGALSPYAGICTPRRWGKSWYVEKTLG